LQHSPEIEILAVFFRGAAQHVQQALFTTFSNKCLAIPQKHTDFQMLQVLRKKNVFSENIQASNLFALLQQIHF